VLLAVGFPPAAHDWNLLAATAQKTKQRKTKQQRGESFLNTNKDDELHLSSFLARAAGTCTHSSKDWRCGALSSGLKLMESIMENSRPETGKALGFCKRFWVLNDCF
jgi:hypothetical protein